MLQGKRLGAGAEGVTYQLDSCLVCKEWRQPLFETEDTLEGIKARYDSTHKVWAKLPDFVREKCRPVEVVGYEMSEDGKVRTFMEYIDMSTARFFPSSDSFEWLPEWKEARDILEQTFSDVWVGHENTPIVNGMIVLVDVVPQAWYRKEVEP